MKIPPNRRYERLAGLGTTLEVGRSMKQLDHFFQRINDWRRERRIERYKLAMCEAFKAGDYREARRQQYLFSTELAERSPMQRQRMQTGRQA
ncbi:hypothetical protein ACUHMQ_06760 [Chitinimonas sp. PSY-7]|uniref:hypothetical protein n=1 Tax=Chitinimonas sp. PSY-7 TaxID=3459088 RepID=UPI00403FE1E1